MREKFALYDDYSATELGAVFGIATTSLKDKLNKAGVRPSFISSNGSTKKYKIADAYQGLMELKNKEFHEESLENPKTHRERLDMLKAEEQELKNKELKGELVSMDEVLGELSAALTKIKSRLLTIPKKSSVRAMELLDRALIEEEMELDIREILEELAKYDTTADSTESDDSLEAAAKDDDKSMG